MATPNTEVTLAVRGMHCSGCVKRLERALAGVDGVSSTKTDLIAGKVVVAFDPSRVTVAALKEAVTLLGFGVAG